MEKILEIWFSFPEKLRFLMVGAWNTVCSLLLFTFIYEITGNYKITLVLSHTLSVAQSFVSFRAFVFKPSEKLDKKKIIEEYLKINIVYAVYFCLNFIFLWLGVNFTRLNPPTLQVIITCFLVILSYFGNKHFTFKDGAEGKR